MNIPKMTREAFLAGWIYLSCSSSIRAEGFNFQDLQEELVSGKYGPVHSLILEFEGERIFDGYYRGSSADDLQLLNSVTKSIGVTLLGMAARDGWVHPEDRLENLLPQYHFQTQPLSVNRELRLQDVLSQRHGLLWDEWSTGFTNPSNSAHQMFASPDWYYFTLSRKRDQPIDTRFTYSTGASTLMSAVLSEITGELPQQTFRNWLAGPLHIDKFDWELWSENGPGSGLRVFPYGEAPLSVGLWLKPEDLLKIGRLWLNSGRHEGKQLLDPDWITRCWTPYSHSGNDPYFAASDETSGYGFQWWYREIRDANGTLHPCWYAWGAGRQYLFVFPRLKLLVVSTGESYDYTGPGVFTALRQKVLPVLGKVISPSRSGAYKIKDRSGQSIWVNISKTDSKVFFEWSTFRNGVPESYQAEGDIVGNEVFLNQVSFRKGGTFDGSIPESFIAGDAKLRWMGPDEAELEYHLDQGEGKYSLIRKN